MNARTGIFLAFLGCLAPAGQTGEPGVLEYAAYPRKADNFIEASFSCLLPARQPRAILFLAGGTDSDARPWLLQAGWRGFAEQERLVLVAACLRGGAGEPYEIASGGSGQALLDAIDRFAVLARRPDLTALPLLLYGHSAGAQFAFSFAGWRPDRVGAIVCLKSGPLETPADRAAARYRALLVVGGKDQAIRVRSAAVAYAAGRALGAPWTFAYQAGGGHGAEGCEELVKAYLRVAIPAGGLAGPYAALENPGLAIEPRLARCSPGATYLPSADFEAIWRSFAGEVRIGRLQALPDEAPECRISWHAVTPLPASIDRSAGQVEFEYAAAPPPGETVAGVFPSGASLQVSSAAREHASSWTIAGHADLRNQPIGPWKAEIGAMIETASGLRVPSTLSLFTYVSGPVQATPHSLYYGIAERGTTRAIDLVIRAADGKGIRACSAESSDPSFLTVRTAWSAHGQACTAHCLLHPGERLGLCAGRITLVVETDRPYTVWVPFYGLVRK